MLENKIQLEYISTEKMLGDPLRKSIPGINMKKFTYKIFKN